jgi:hypothetical protein
MPKRPFERERGHLVDWIDDEELGRHRFLIPLEPDPRTPPEDPARKKNRLLRSLKKGSTSAARELGEFAEDAEVRQEVLRAFASPRIRWETMDVLERLQGDDVAEVATNALTDEPDEWLAAKLRDIAGRTSAPPSGTVPGGT